jgi:hypothetical protein
MVMLVFVYVYHILDKKELLVIIYSKIKKIHFEETEKSFFVDAKNNIEYFSI